MALITSDFPPFSFRPAAAAVRPPVLRDWAGPGRDHRILPAGHPSHVCEAANPRNPRSPRDPTRSCRLQQHRHLAGAHRVLCAGYSGFRVQRCNRHHHLQLGLHRVLCGDNPALQQRRLVAACDRVQLRRHHAAAAAGPDPVCCHHQRQRHDGAGVVHSTPIRGTSLL